MIVLQLLLFQRLLLKEQNDAAPQSG